MTDPADRVGSIRDSEAIISLCLCKSAVVLAQKQEGENLFEQKKKRKAFFQFFHPVANNLDTHIICFILAFASSFHNKQQFRSVT
jgi:hypothetical protein